VFRGRPVRYLVLKQLAPKSTALNALETV
jgi:hypothetical protein